MRIPFLTRVQLPALIAVCFLLVLSGCKSSKKVGTVVSGGAKAHNEFFEAMEEHSFQFNTMTARLNAELKGTKNNMSSRVDLKMVKDSAFQLSVQPFKMISGTKALSDRIFFPTGSLHSSFRTVPKASWSPMITTNVFSKRLSDLSLDINSPIARSV